MMEIVRTAYAFVVTLLALLLAVPVLVLALPFWVVAFLTRSIVRLLEPRTASWRELVEFDPTIGWRPRANLNAFFVVEGDEVFHVVTDSAGWPGKGELAESQMVVFGDSLAFGFGVNAARSYRELIPHLRIKAVSAPGYNLVQQLLLMRDVAPQLAGKLVVWFIYHGNDLFDNLSPLMGPYRTPFVRETDGDAGWEIVNSHLSPRRWRYSSYRHRGWEQDLASLYSATLLSKRAYAACDFLMREARAVCDRVGAQLVVYSIPSPYALGDAAPARLARHSQTPDLFDADFPDRQISEICRRHDVLFVAGKRHLSIHDYKSVDDHWNERGHQHVAEALSHLYQDYAEGTMGGANLTRRALVDSRVSP